MSIELLGMWIHEAVCICLIARHYIFASKLLRLIKQSGNHLFDKFRIHLNRNTKKKKRKKNYKQKTHIYIRTTILKLDWVALLVYLDRDESLNEAINNFINFEW